MVRISERVWERWQALEAHFDEPAIVLLFSTALSREDVIAALGEAASEAVRGLEVAGEPPPGEDERRSGHWSLAPVPEGVAVRIDEEPDHFENLLRGIAVGLEARGVEGDFEIYEPTEVVVLPEVVDLFELRLRVDGERYHIRYRNYGWRADSDALWSTVEAGVEWCTENWPDLPLSLMVGLITSSTLQVTDDVDAYMRQALRLTADLGVVRLTSAAPERFRTVAVDASRGRVTFIEGGTAIAKNSWNPRCRVCEKQSLQRRHRPCTDLSSAVPTGRRPSRDPRSGRIGLRCPTSTRIRPTESRLRTSLLRMPSACSYSDVVTPVGYQPAQTGNEL